MVKKFVLILDLCNNFDGNDQMASGEGFSKLCSQLGTWASWTHWCLALLLWSFTQSVFAFCILNGAFNNIGLIRMKTKQNPKPNPQIYKETACSMNANTANAINLSLKQMLFVFTGRTKALSLEVRRLTFQSKINCQLLLVSFPSLYDFCFILNIFAFWQVTHCVCTVAK